MQQPTAAQPTTTSSCSSAATCNKAAQQITEDLSIDLSALPIALTNGSAATCNKTAQLTAPGQLELLCTWLCSSVEPKKQHTTQSLEPQLSSNLRQDSAANSAGSGQTLAVGMRSSAPCAYHAEQCLDPHKANIFQI
jgi:hypothetical protein